MKLKKVIYKFNIKEKVNSDTIKNGYVYVNNIKTTNLEYDVKNNDLLKIFDDEFIYKDIVNLVVYKPKGYLSARKDEKHKCVVELLKKPYSYFKYSIAGRLDLDSEGLLILTTSGRFANSIANPIFNIIKEYEVELDRDILDIDIKNLKEPMLLRDNKFKLYKSYVHDVLRLTENKIIVKLKMGKYHQIKEMVKKIGYSVVNLKRTKIANLELKSLKQGDYYEFLKEDIKI